jgi:hypothetical protein
LKHPKYALSGEPVNFCGASARFTDASVNLADAPQKFTGSPGKTFAAPVKAGLARSTLKFARSDPKLSMPGAKQARAQRETRNLLLSGAARFLKINQNNAGIEIRKEPQIPLPTLNQ